MTETQLRPRLAGRRSRIVALLPLALALLLLGLLVPTAAARDETRRCPTDALQIGHDAQPLRPAEGCSLSGRTVAMGRLVTAIPEPGMGVTVVAIDENGATSAMVVRSRADGTVTIGHGDDDTFGNTQHESGTSFGKCKDCPPSCKDKSYTLLGHKQHDGDIFEWFYNERDATTALSPDVIFPAINAAMNGVMNAKNNCKLTDEVEIEATYEGSTENDADASPTGGCFHYSQTDGVSVVDWGELVAPGFACNWFQIVDGPDRLVQSDILLDRTNAWTTTPGVKGCSNRFDLQGIMAHEFAHTFGLGHVDSSHGNLTMTTRGLGPCSKAFRTYGLGDIKALRSLY